MKAILSMIEDGDTHSITNCGPVGVILDVTYPPFLKMPNKLVKLAPGSTVTISVEAKITAKTALSGKEVDGE